jgi:uncharacterized protein (TIGR01777 family)
MHVVVTGATGTIGRATALALLDRGDTVTGLSRDAARARKALPAAVEIAEWADPLRAAPPADALRRAGAVVHMLGEPVDQRWTAAARRRIYDSRVMSTRLLAGALLSLPAQERPAVLIAQSATGIYGRSDDRPLDEGAPVGEGFLADVVKEWERAANVAGAGLRVACLRTGVVLSPRGGALSKMLPFFRLGLGGPVAGGRQYVPWVHLDDVVGAVLHALDDESVAGPVNVTAPQPVTNSELSRALARALRRPAFLPVPGLALRGLYGAMAELVVSGQRVIPQRLTEQGYEFRHPVVGPALQDVLAR